MLQSSKQLIILGMRAFLSSVWIVWNAIATLFVKQKAFQAFCHSGGGHLVQRSLQPFSRHNHMVYLILGHNNSSNKDNSHNTCVNKKNLQFYDDAAAWFIVEFNNCNFPHSISFNIVLAGRSWAIHLSHFSYRLNYSSFCFLFRLGITSYTPWYFWIQWLIPMRLFIVISSPILIGLGIILVGFNLFVGFRGEPQTICNRQWINVQ